MLPPFLCTQAMHYSVNVQLAFQLCLDYTIYIGPLCCLSCLYTASVVMRTQFAPFSCFDLLGEMLAIFFLATK